MCGLIFTIFCAYNIIDDYYSCDEDKSVVN